jgi:hypothetical protein
LTSSLDRIQTPEELNRPNIYTRPARQGEYIHLISALRRIHITDQNTRENTYT